MTDSTLNDQIADAVEQVTSLLEGSEGPLHQAVAHQVSTLSVSLAMFNAVAQQQQASLLRNAMTTAIINEVLKSSPEKAMSLVEQAVGQNDIAQTLKELQQMLDSLSDRPSQEKAPPKASSKAKPSTSESRPAGRKSKARRKG